MIQVRPIATGSHSGKFPWFRELSVSLKQHIEERKALWMAPLIIIPPIVGVGF